MYTVLPSSKTLKKQSFCLANCFDTDRLYTSATLQKSNSPQARVRIYQACWQYCLRYWGKMNLINHLCPNWKTVLPLWRYYRCRARFTARPNPLGCLSRTTGWNCRPNRKKCSYWTWTAGRKRSERIVVLRFMLSLRPRERCYCIIGSCYTIQSKVLNRILRFVFVAGRGT